MTRMTTDMGTLARIAVSAGIVALLAIPTFSAEKWEKAGEMWSDPVFQKQFMGSYGTRSEVEPSVTTVEKTHMEKVMEMMAEDEGTDKTRMYLERVAKPAASAIFDFTLANIYFQQDKLEIAADWYEKAVAKFPGFQRAYKNLGLVYVRLGNYDKAGEPLTKAIELGAGDGLTFGLLGFAHLMTGHFTSAEGAYRQAMMLQPNTVDWKLGLARCLFKQSKFEEAVTLCEELISLDPERSEYWMLQANAYLGMRRPMRAAANYEYLHLAEASTPDSLNTLGDIYVNENLMDLAADAYIRAMKSAEEPDHDKFLRNAEVLAARSAYNEAGNLLGEIKQTSMEVLNNEQKKRLLKLEARLATASGAAIEDQIALMQEIIKIDPLDGEALILLGRHYASSDMMDKASFYFERAAGIEGYEAKACLRHAQSLVKNARYQDAIPLLKRAQELDPREDVARYVEQVERVARMQ